MKDLVLKGISKRFGQCSVIRSLDLKIDAGSITALTGESGSGKTTILRLIAGLDELDEGEIRLGDQDLSRLLPERRNIGFVFQNLALFPHLSVEKNIAFPLGKARKKDRENKIRYLLEVTGLQRLERRYPHQLSGGQQQRVALARALATDPGILLMDEPFSNLDEILKSKVRTEIYNIVKSLGITTVIVTHYAVDAFMIADKVVILQNGKILQGGTPTEIYQNPVSDYVSDFFGASVILQGYKTPGGISTGFGKIPFDKIPEKETFKLFIRPENMQITSMESAELSGIIKGKIFKGPHEILIIENKNQDQVIHFETEQSSYTKGDKIYLKTNKEKLLIFPEDVR